MAASSLAALIVEWDATVVESIVHLVLHSDLAITPEVFHAVRNSLWAVCCRGAEHVAAGFLAAFVVKGHPTIVQAIIHAVLNPDLTVLPEICKVDRQVAWAF